MFWRLWQQNWRMDSLWRGGKERHGLCIALCWLVSPDGPSNCLPFSPFTEAAHSFAGQISKDRGQGHPRWREPLQLRLCHTWPSSDQSVGCRTGAQGLNPPPKSCVPAADLRCVFMPSRPLPSPESLSHLATFSLLPPP